MSSTPQSDAMTLSGLAQANGPWLAVRLRRLAEHAGVPLPESVVEEAVTGSSRVLALVLDAEGRPAVSPELAADPAAAFGREQAKAHRSAGLDMPGSVRTLRLMRRAFDDLVRESWVEKESRARAHEDVERFFERMLIGHFIDWAGSASAPPPPPPAQADGAEALARTLAEREAELARLKTTARRAATELRAERERAAKLEADMAQARNWVQTQTQAQEALKAELAQARAAAGSGDEAQAAQAARLKSAETALAQAQGRADALAAEAEGLKARLEASASALGAQKDIEDARDLALAEIDNARAEAEQAKNALELARREAAQAVTRAEAEVLNARREAEIARDELRAAVEGHAALISEAEAMRLRLAEAGSRLGEARKEEEESFKVRLAKATERIGALEAELRAALTKTQALAENLAQQESLHAFKDERMAEQSRAIAETQELLVRLGATKDEIIARATGAEAERDRVAAELAAAKAELARLGAQGAEAGAKTQAAAAEIARLRRELASARGELAGRVEALTIEKDGLAARLLASGQNHEKAARRAQAAEGLLAAHLAQAGDAMAALDASGAISAMNPRFAGLFGLAEADREAGLAALLPRMAARLQNPEPWLARMRELLASPAKAEEGLLLATATGQTLVFRSRPAPGGDGPEGRLLLLQDVSLERDLDALVREIESVTRAELGQSLTAFIHLPEELLSDPATPKAHAEKLATIRDSGYRIVNTINMALDIFRMEQGRYSPPIGRTLDLAVCARRAAKDLAPLAESKAAGIMLSLDGQPLPADAVLSAPGDPIPAHALVASLLRDALMGAPVNGAVRVNLGADAEGLRLEVARPGDLTPEAQARFFDKPLNASDAGARARYIARLIATHLGGALAVSSGPDAGTTATFRLPKG